MRMYLKYVFNRVLNSCNYIALHDDSDEKSKSYTIDIPEDMTEKEAPFMLSLFLKTHRVFL